MADPKIEKEFSSYTNVEGRVINYLFVFGYFLTFILFVVFMLGDQPLSGSMFRLRMVVVVVFFAFVLGFDLGTRKFASKISINQSDGEVRFYMLRSNDSVVVPAEAIQKVRIDLYVTFVLDGKKIIYNAARNESLIEELKSRFPVTLGIWARILTRLGFKD